MIPRSLTAAISIRCAPVAIYSCTSLFTGKPAFPAGAFVTKRIMEHEVT
jgi:hypothetical protein